jgi:hypothetical protein
MGLLQPKHLYVFTQEVQRVSGIQARLLVVYFWTFYFTKT